MADPETQRGARSNATLRWFACSAGVTASVSDRMSNPISQSGCCKLRAFIAYLVSHLLPPWIPA
jgi:hypothetical protein